MLANSWWVWLMLLILAIDHDLIDPPIWITPFELLQPQLNGPSYVNDTFWTSDVTDPAKNQAAFTHDCTGGLIIKEKKTNPYKPQLDGLENRYPPSSRPFCWRFPGPAITGRSSHLCVCRCFGRPIQSSVFACRLRCEWQCDWVWRRWWKAEMWVTVWLGVKEVMEGWDVSDSVTRCEGGDGRLRCEWQCD